MPPKYKTKQNVSGNDLDQILCNLSNNTVLYRTRDNKQ